MRTFRSTLAIGFLPLVVAACGAGALDQDLESSDGKFAVALSAKADGGLSDCELATVLTWVNDPAMTAHALKMAGVHSRAATNIIATRDGADGQPGTTDDVVFTTLRQLDDVYYVGPKALEQLQRAVAESCAATSSELEVVFSPREYWHSHLGELQGLIDDTQHSIDIAMYSFGDGGLMEALERAVDRGVVVRLIFNSALSDKSNLEGSRSARLESMGVDVRYVNKIMHHKFAIIDGPQQTVAEAASAILVSGSGNWSYSAGTKYDENTVFHYGNERLNLMFQQEFNHLWANSRDLVYNESLSYRETLAITEAMIPTHGGADVVFTSHNMKTYVSSTYGNTFGVIAGLNTVSDRLVNLIESAEQSIWIASGHLRSRPIAEAVMAAAERNPSLDVRVYLDGQEYTSEWLHAKQEHDLLECLSAAAASESKTQKCLDVGFKFGQAMHQHPGVDLRYKYYSYRWDYTYAVQMHHKYMLVDGRWLATGSYNYSDNAEHNTIENCAIYDGQVFPELIASFAANFLAMWDTGRSEGLYEAKMDEILNGTEDFWIVFPSMALDSAQVSALKSAIREHCPQVDDEEWRKNPSAHKVCPR